MNNTFKVFLITFVGSLMFGFIDNFILVVAGNAIDMTIADTLGFSTMASAGIGNAISDTVGVLGEGLMLLAVIKLFGEANENGVSRSVIVTAGATGIFVGCIIGMFPLLFI